MALETKTWPGQPRISWTTKINPLWWFGNVEGLDTGYMPEWPMWKRRLFWFFRNFAYNFFRFVVGVEDREVAVTGPWPVFTTTAMEAWGTPGFKNATIKVGVLTLPFWCYSDAHWTWYFGWLPSGGRLGAKLNYRF